MDEEQEEIDDDAVYHFGVRGMQWGVRSGKGTTGVSRSAGGKIEQNERTIKQLHKNVEPGAKRVLKNIAQHGALGAAVMATPWYKKKMQVAVKDLNAQSERFKSGTANKRDKFGSVVNTTLAEKFIVRKS